MRAAPVPASRSASRRAELRYHDAVSLLGTPAHRFLAVLVGPLTLAVAPLAACGSQTPGGQTTSVPLIGYVSFSPTQPSGFTDGFADGLRALGYVEAQNIMVDRRYGGGDQQ